MYALAVKASWEPLRSIGFAAISGTYMGVGSNFDNPLRMLIIENLTDALMLFSFDGVTDNFVLPAGGPVILDFCSNKTIANGFYFPDGSRVYVRDGGAAATTGSVYVSAIYGKD